MTGKVWLVGAGPGDAGLLTRKGYEVLKDAQVVVYDSLVSDAILAMIPRDAVKIDAGKRAGNHHLRQEQTNQVLLEQALAGNRVVRLKGGDPFLFGRGGEELELLRENDVPYEIVPGVTSAISVPAYNGIPVTHRDFTSSVHIITGQKKQGQPYNIDFEALVRTKGTLVFLMGVSALPDICSALMEAGMRPDMPAAVLQEGTTAGQRRVVATLETLPHRAKEENIGTPGIIVVGKVCALAENFYWWEKLPLSGSKILVTRPKELASTMSDKLRGLGAEVVVLPAVRTEAISDNEKLQNAFKKIRDYAWIAFTSPTGVRIFFEEMEKAELDIRCLAGAKIAAVGTGTRKALKKHGILADLVPETYDGENLGKALAAVAGKDEKILIPRASIGNHEIIDALDGFMVDDIPTYDTISCPQEVVDVAAAVENGKVSCAVFTSSSSVKGFAQAYPEVDFTKLTAACIGAQTCETAKRYGMICRTAEKATIDSLLELVISLNTK